MTPVAPPVDGAAVHRTLRRRLLPPLFVLSLCCQLDRANLSFAALQMSADLPFFSRTVQGLGSGLFFIGYLLQIPASAACIALGHRRFLPAILLAWGAVAMLFAAARSTASFLLLRLLLGAAEAGAYPGVMYCLSLFYPPRNLGLAYTAVATATAVAGLLGGPLAAAIMALDGAAGLRGWQWLFLVEGVPPLLLAAALPLLLPGSPHTAWFLTPAERQWLWEEVSGQEGGGIELVPAAPPTAAAELQGLKAVEAGAAAGCPDAAGGHERWGARAGSTTVAQPGTPAATALATPASSPTAAAAGAEPQVWEEETSVLLNPPSKGKPASSSGSSSGSSNGSGSGGTTGSGGGLRGALWRGLLDRRVFHLALVMLLVDVTMNACNFWLPTLVKAALQGQLQSDGGGKAAGPGSGLAPPPPAPGPAGAAPAAGSSGDGGLALLIHASLLSALPFCGAAACMVVNAWHARRANERHLHIAAPMLAAALAWAVLPPAAALGPAPALVALTVAASGIWATHGPLFSWPSAFLDRKAAAIGFALVKTGGAVGAFAGPAVIGWMADALHGYTGAMLLLACVAAASAALVYVFNDTATTASGCVADCC